MIPYDGFGYGVSHAIEYAAKNIAYDNGEECTHWKYPEDGIHDISIMIYPLDALDYGIEVICKPILFGTCDKKFPKTEQALKQRFKDLNQ